MISTRGYLVFVTTVHRRCHHHRQDVHREPDCTEVADLMGPCRLWPVYSTVVPPLAVAAAVIFRQLHGILPLIFSPRPRARAIYDHESFSTAARATPLRLENPFIPRMARIIIMMATTTTTVLLQASHPFTPEDMTGGRLKLLTMHLLLARTRRIPDPIPMDSSVTRRTMAKKKMVMCLRGAMDRKKIPTTKLTSTMETPEVETRRWH
mmetsp:Transcript_7260/g.15856  ORF Transcript_7260/g.15856 Transcript_7260/m.15856 type:complete len:208 (+) Transcript_7260:20-643(+)